MLIVCMFFFLICSCHLQSVCMPNARELGTVRGRGGEESPRLTHVDLNDSPVTALKC